jgi:hypothetical protein
VGTFQAILEELFFSALMRLVVLTSRAKLCHLTKGCHGIWTMTVKTMSLSWSSWISLATESVTA